MYGEPDDDALVLAIYQHIAVHVIGQGVDVRRVLVGGLRPIKQY